MKKYILKIKILSSLASPLMADTIWGHICWGIRNHEGEEKLKEFINLYEENNPPLILSDPFPENLLPRPILKPNIFSINELNLDNYKKIKKIKKIKYLKKELFEKHELSEKMFFNDESFLKENSVIKVKKSETLRNIIDRRTNQTKETDGIYSVKEIWYDKDNMFDIYILSNLSKDDIVKYFKWGFEFGYGADTSIGKGHIDVIEDSIKEIEVNHKNPNRVMVLSNFIPTVEEKNKFNNFRYNIFTKFGKVGNQFVYEEVAFKKPIVFYTTGSTFDIIKEEVGSFKEYVGKLLSNIHKNDKIKHYAYAPLLFFKELEE